MTPLSQRDPRWKNIKLGTSSTSIGDYGCTISCLAMIIGTTPDVVNERLNSVNGFAEGNLVVWAKIEEAFPGIKVKRVWSYDNADVLKNVPNVLVEVDGKPIGGYRHWVVFIGNKLCLDPWDGKEKSTSSYPSPLSYCVIGGRWNKPSPTQDTLPVDKAVFENLVRKATITDKVRSKLNVEDSETIILSELEKLIKYEDSVAQKDTQLQEAQRKIGELESRLQEILTTNNNLSEDNKKLSQEIDTQKLNIMEQGGIITTLTKEVEDLKSSAKLPTFTGWKRKLIEFISSL